MTHKLGIETRRSGGGGTVHNLTLDEALDMLQRETNTDETLHPLSDYTPEDFQQGLTVVAVNRCVDDPEVVTRTITTDDLSENLEGNPTVPISLDSLTVYYSMQGRDDNTDVIRVIEPDVQ